jgi:hypothetical protein
MEEDNRRIKASFQLFDILKCCSGTLKDNFDDVNAALRSVDVDKMRCLIINCLIALHLVQTAQSNKREDTYNENYKIVKNRVFNAAISMITGGDFNWDEAVVETILSRFPDEKEISGDRSWLPEHFTIALAVRNKISEDDIRIMLSFDPSVIHRLRRDAVSSENDIDGIVGIAGIHQSFMCDAIGRCALHLVAQYSVSLELLQDILQIDYNMTKMATCTEEVGGIKKVTPLGSLRRRPQFSTFDKMFLCLIEVNSTAKVISNGIIQCMLSCKKGLFHDLSPGSSGERSLIVIRNLLDANPAVTNYNHSCIFHAASLHLRGELFVSVLSLFHIKDSTGVKAVYKGFLPIHVAVRCGEGPS